MPGHELITSNLFVLIEEIETLFFKKWARNLSNVEKKSLKMKICN